jgi:Na+-driven multidrug efflux pump
MGFCNGSCAGFAIPVAQAFGAKDYAKMRAYVSNSIRTKTSPVKSNTA